VAEWPKAPAC